MSPPINPLLARGTPPEEVLAQIAEAAISYERLLRRGQQLRFGLGARPRSVAIELFDGVRGRSTTLTVTQAVEIACSGQAG
jgi:hypothetical protein